MKRYRQTIDEILEQLSPVETSWLDEHAKLAIQKINSLPHKTNYDSSDLTELLNIYDLPDNIKSSDRFDICLTAVRLFLDMSKDEFYGELRQQLTNGTGITQFRKDPETYCTALVTMNVLVKMTELVNKPITWRDLLVERLKGGRGSAIKGQRRGRSLEDFVEELIINIFGENSYKARCQFTGATGTSSEKTDFAIPSESDPAILIEAKAYGATGSKQTDVLGDITRIVNEKRNDTHFLLVTDGITWRDRTSDLNKLIQLQNQGKIARIYTRSMVDQLEADLIQLKQEYDL